MAQAISVAPVEQVEAVDLRDGHPFPPETWRGKRLRVGDHYDLPERMKTLRFSMQSHYGLGDTLMATPGIAAAKREWPHLKIIVHHGWAAGDLLKSNPDIDEVVRLDERRDAPPSDCIDVNPMNGQSGGVQATFDILGLGDKASDRHIRLHLTAEERGAALGKLTAWAKPEARGDLTTIPLRLYGIQQHGGWTSKRYAHAGQLAEILLARGDWVIMLGNDNARKTDIPEHPHCISGNGMTIREVAALISMMDAVVGMDSGITWISASQSVPTVALFGHSDPKGYLMDAAAMDGEAAQEGRGAANLVAIRKLTPQMCFEAHGISCLMTSGGSKCPLREGPGGECYDSIPPAEIVAHLDALPTLGTPLSERVGR